MRIGDGGPRGEAALDGDWLGLHDLTGRRGPPAQGLGTQVLGALLEWGAERGATTAWLHVEVDNDPARALYERVGFRTHHTCRYLRWGSDAAVSKRRLGPRHQAQPERPLEGSTTVPASTMPSDVDAELGRGADDLGGLPGGDAERQVAGRRDRRDGDEHPDHRLGAVGGQRQHAGRAGDQRDHETTRRPGAR